MPCVPEDAEIEQVVGPERQGRDNEGQHACRDRPETTPYDYRDERDSLTRRGQGELLSLVELG